MGGLTNKLRMDLNPCHNFFEPFVFLPLRFFSSSSVRFSRSSSTYKRVRKAICGHDILTCQRTWSFARMVSLMPSSLISFFSSIMSTLPVGLTLKSEEPPSTRHRKTSSAIIEKGAAGRPPSVCACCLAVLCSLPCRNIPPFPSSYPLQKRATSLTLQMAMPNTGQLSLATKQEVSLPLFNSPILFDP